MIFSDLEEFLMDELEIILAAALSAHHDDRDNAIVLGIKNRAEEALKNAGRYAFGEDVAEIERP